MGRGLSAFVGAIACAVAGTQAAADELGIATWNLSGAEGLENRADNLAKAGGYFSGLDFVVLEETLGEAQVEEVLEKAGLIGWHFAVSDFTRDDSHPDEPFMRLEVAILSPYPIARTREADPHADDDTAAGAAADEDVVVPSFIPADQRDELGFRGWLWAEFDDLKLVVAGVHLKSARGDTGREDEPNSFQRESVSAALIDTIRSHEAENEGWSYIVAGDFNVAPGDDAKVGTDLKRRCTAARCTGYDNTHALFGAGLVFNFSMLNLVAGLGRSFAAGAFAKSPIDNIYVRGPLFDDTVRVTAERGDTFGSDHHAIRATVADE